MSFQKFRYTLQNIEGYSISPKGIDHPDYFHTVKTEWDNKGNILTFYTELSFDKPDGSKHIVQGLTYYFVPLGQDFFDSNFIIGELLYQTYCRQAGFVQGICKVTPKFLPTVQRLYDELGDTSEYPLK